MSFLSNLQLWKSLKTTARCCRSRRKSLSCSSSSLYWRFYTGARWNFILLTIQFEIKLNSIDVFTFVPHWSCPYSIKMILIHQIYTSEIISNVKAYSIINLQWVTYILKWRGLQRKFLKTDIKDKTIDKTFFINSAKLS